MFRTLAAVFATLIMVPGVFGQRVIQAPHVPSRPAGVIAPPALPIPGSLTPPGYTPPRPHLRPFLAPNPYFNSWGFAPYWPTWSETQPAVVNSFIPVPVPTLPSPTPVAPPPPPELRARLTLTVPNGASVWLAGKELDANVKPLILESPILQPSQTYTFNLKVTWPEGQRTEERTRVVIVAAGDSKSLAYFR